MKKMMLILIVMSIAFLLNACLTSSDREVKDVKISKASDIYGVWKWDNSGELCGLGGSCELTHYYVFDETEKSYQLRYSIDAENKVVFSILPMTWVLNDGKSIVISPNLSVIGSYLVRPEEPKFGSFVDGFSAAYSYTISNLDSLKMGLIAVDSLGGHIPYIHGGPDSLSWVIIQSKSDDAQKYLHVVEDSCYKEYEGTTNLTGLCDVRIYEKVTDLDLAGILSVVDTVSSTDLLRDLYKEEKIPWPGVPAEE